MNFLKPTKQKIIVWIIVLSGMILSGMTSSPIEKILFPYNNLDPNLKNTFKEMLGKLDFSALISYGIELLIVRAIVTLIVMYLGVCLIFSFLGIDSKKKHDKKNT